MTHFIKDNTTLAAAKSNFARRPEVPADRKVTEDDWNEFRQALVDIQGFIRGADWYGVDGDGNWLKPVDVVDLRVGAYAITPEDATPATAATNTANLNAAIAAYSGTNKTLVLPAGTIYFEQANPGQGAAQRAWSIRFGPGVSKLGLVGQGSNVTKIVQAGDGNGGQWDAIVVDGASRITLAGFSVEQGTIVSPDAGDHNALIGVYAAFGVNCSDITISDVFFGPCIGDALRVAGDGASVAYVERLRVTNFTMRTGGHAQGAGGLGLGSRSGVSFQRGFRDVVIGDGFIHGAKNSPFEMEPTGTNICNNIAIHDLVLDNQGGQTYLALTVAGVSTAPLRRVVMDNIIVLQGGMTIAYAYDATLRGVTVYSSGLGPMAGNSQALVQMINTNEDVALANLKVIRDTGSTAGPLMTVTHGVGAGNTTKRLKVSGEMYSAVGAGAGLVYLDCYGPDSPKLENLTLRLAATAGTEYGVKFRPNTDDLVNPVVDGVYIIGGGTKLLAGLYFVATNATAVNDIHVTNVRAKDAVTIGVLFDVNGGSGIDAAPVLQGCDFSGATDEWKAQNAAAGVVFPIIAGSKGTTARRWQVGTVAPEGVVTAPQGARYTRQNADQTSEWIKQVGTGNTGWEMLQGSLIIPSLIGAGPTQNYAPTNIDNAMAVRQGASAAAAIGGLQIAAASLGRNRPVLFMNVSTFAITLNHEDAGSTAANRFYLPSGANLVIPPSGSCLLRYDTTTGRWRAASGS